MVMALKLMISGHLYINNNNNTVTSTGNDTIPTPPELPTCEECFTQNLNSTQLADLEEAFENGGIDISFRPGEELNVINSFAELCTFLEDVTSERQLDFILFQVLGKFVDDENTLDEIARCIVDVLDLDLLPLPQP
jgi:hypothetical protein